ncbi:MAG TPA: hypothetical protein VGL86_10675 [Polyangia bacterium]
MRAWISVVAIVAGCSGAGQRATSSTDGDPLSQPEVPLAAATLPGKLAAAWPLPIARGANAWLLPYANGGEVYARFVADDGSTDDRDLDHGTIVGAAALADGFALAVADGADARVHFLASDGSDAVVSATNLFAGGASAVPGIASDGSCVLVVAVTGGDIAADGPTPLSAALALVDHDGGARAIPLGGVDAAPAPWGDTQGFIVGATLVVDGSGVVAPAPGRQIRDARLFRRASAAGAQPTSDIISLDGSIWRDVGGLVGWAGRGDDGDGAALELVTDNGRALVEVGQDLTQRSSVALPSTTRGDGGQSWIAGVSGAHVVWASTVENDPVFAILDASRMRVQGGVTRIRNATSRTTIVSPGAAAVLLAWSEAGGVVRYGLAPW